MEIRIKEPSKEEGFEWYNTLVTAYAAYINNKAHPDIYDLDELTRAYEIAVLADMLRRIHDVGEL